MARGGDRRGGRAPPVTGMPSTRVVGHLLQRVGQGELPPPEKGEPALGFAPLLRGLPGEGGRGIEHLSCHVGVELDEVLDDALSVVRRSTMRRSRASTVGGSRRRLVGRRGRSLGLHGYRERDRRCRAVPRCRPPAPGPARRSRTAVKSGCFWLTAMPYGSGLNDWSDDHCVGVLCVEPESRLRCRCRWRRPDPVGASPGNRPSRSRPRPRCAAHPARRPGCRGSPPRRPRRRACARGWRDR